MNNKEIEVIKSMCDCDMNVSRVAKKLHYHRDSIRYQIEKIKEKFGLNPQSFHDLVKLQKMINLEDKEESNGKVKK